MNSSGAPPLRVGYSCHDSFPSNDINTQQIFWTLSEVAGLGVDVTLIVPALSVSGSGMRQAIASHHGVGDRFPEGFRIVSSGAGTPAGSIDRARFDWRVPHQLKRDQYDVVWTRDPVAAAASARAGLPTVFETYRPDYALRGRFALWRRLSLGGLRGVITHSQLATDAFVAAGVPRARCLVARNGFAPRLMEPRLDRAAARQLLGLPADQRLVLYAGHVGRDKGIETLVETAARLPDATFLLLGAAPDRGGREWIAGLTRQAEASNIVLRPRVPAVDVAPYLYAADCLVVPPYDDPARRYRWRMLPIKVYSYLAAGRPIVAPKLPDIEEVLNDRVARLVPSLDATAWASAIADVLNDRALQEELGAGARAASMNFTWAARARLIVDFLRTL